MTGRSKARDRTRGRIETALIRLLATRPYAAMTVADIACEAGVSARTVHRYFRSKDDLLAAALRYPAEAIAEEVQGRATPESAEEAIAGLVEAMFAVYNRHRLELWAAYSRAGDVPELAKATQVATTGWLSLIENLFSRWPDVWNVERELAKREIVAFTSYPAWRGLAGAGGFGSPEAELLVADVLCRHLLRGERSSPQR